MWLKKALDFSERGTKSVARGINGVGVTALTLLMLLTAVDVCLRYLFDSPITGSYELSEFMMAILVAFGLALVITAFLLSYNKVRYGFFL